MTEVASPCIKQCKLDASGRYCTGCLRTLDEISGWSRAGNAQKQAALDRIASLRQPLAVRQLHCTQCGSAFACGSGGSQGGLLVRRAAPAGQRRSQPRRLPVPGLPAKPAGAGTSPLSLAGQKLTTGTACRPPAP